MKKWIIEAKPCPTDYNPTPQWYQQGEDYTDEAEAEREWELQADLHGHDTYIRLVEIERKVLREC